MTVNNDDVMLQVLGSGRVRRALGTWGRNNRLLRGWPGSRGLKVHSRSRSPLGLWSEASDFSHSQSVMGHLLYPRHCSPHCDYSNEQSSKQTDKNACHS